MDHVLSVGVRHVSRLRRLTFYTPRTQRLCAGLATDAPPALATAYGIDCGHTHFRAPPPKQGSPCPIRAPDPCPPQEGRARVPTLIVQRRAFHRFAGVPTVCVGKPGIFRPAGGRSENLPGIPLAIWRLACPPQSGSSPRPSFLQTLHHL